MFGKKKKTIKPFVATNNHSTKEDTWRDDCVGPSEYVVLSNGDIFSLEEKTLTNENEAIGIVNNQNDLTPTI